MTRPGWFGISFPRQPPSPHRTRPQPRAATRPIPRQLPAEAIDAGDARRLGSRQFDPQAALPKNAAILVVQRSHAMGKEVFTVQGFGSTCLDPVPPSEDYGRPQLELDKVSQLDADGHGQARDLFGRLLNFSDPDSKSELLTWLARLLRDHPDGLRLSICDSTDFNIPWELLWIEADPDSQRPAGPLGALATVVRDLRRSSRRSTGAPGREAGQARHIAYFVAPDVEATSEAIEDFCRRRFDTLQTLLQGLAAANGNGQTFGVAYVGAHGETGKDAEELRMADTFTLNQLETLLAAGLACAPNLVILNVCHSGHAVLNGAVNDMTPRSFARSFLLRGGVPAVIATTSTVGTAAGNCLVKGLLKQLHEEDGADIATGLRDQRRRIAEPVLKAPGEASEADIRQMIFAGFYAYFGDPNEDVTIQLVAEQRSDR